MPRLGGGVKPKPGMAGILTVAAGFLSVPAAGVPEGVRGEQSRETEEQ